jgi:hypothetical protein
MSAKTFNDVLAAFRAGSKGSRGVWDDFLTNTLRNADSATYQQVTKSMGTALSADTKLINTFTNVVDDDTLVAVLKNADTSVAETLVKNMDNEALNRVVRADPALARSLNIQNVQIPSVAELVVRQGGTNAQATKVSEASANMVKNQDPLNAAKTNDVGLDTAKNPPLAEADDAAEEATTAYVRDEAGLGNDVSDAELGTAITNGGEIAKNSGTVRKALEKLGIIAVGSDIATFTRRHWMKMGAAMVILCMMYDTNNPFTALDRALEDVDDLVDGLKELADAAANAAGNAAKGGFDLIAFMTQNWWMSLICCVMILFIGVAATLS